MMIIMIMILMMMMMIIIMIIIMIIMVIIIIIILIIMIMTLVSIASQEYVLIHLIFYEPQVHWRAKKTRVSTGSQDAELSSQLVSILGKASCPGGEMLCRFNVSLKRDDVPEYQSSFIVELTGSPQGATIDPASKYANVTVLESDYPDGLVQFNIDSL